MNCKECGDWICKAQANNHDGMCVEHAPLKAYKYKRNNHEIRI